jgi:hypothetical protein
MHRTESRGRARVDMDTSRMLMEKVLDELRPGISGCTENSISRVERAVFISLYSRLLTEKYTTIYERKIIGFG